MFFRGSVSTSTYPSQRFNSFCYDDDDDDGDYTVAITPDFPITDSLIMKNEHLDTIPEIELDELIKFSVENLVLIPTNCDPEEDVHLMERFLYDNSSPRPLEYFNSKNSDVTIESFSPSLIPIEDSDPFMEEINLFLASDGSIPLDSCSWFCPSITRSSHPQLHFGNLISKSYRL
nr:hypothetical protein [Tanacetum cinerariifolium]